MPGVDSNAPEGKIELRYEFEPTGKPDVKKGKGCAQQGAALDAKTEKQEKPRTLRG